MRQGRSSRDQSAVRSQDPDNPNNKIPIFTEGEEAEDLPPATNFVRIKSEQEGDPVDASAADLNADDEGYLAPDELLGRTFLLETDEDGQRIRSTIEEKVD